MEGAKEGVETWGGTWGGVGGHGLQRDMSVSFPPSQRKESSLDGEVGCGSSAGGGGCIRRLRPDTFEELRFSFRLRNMGAGRRTRRGEGLRWKDGCRSVTGQGISGLTF